MTTQDDERSISPGKDLIGFATQVDFSTNQPYPQALNYMGLYRTTAGGKNESANTLLKPDGMEARSLEQKQSGISLQNSKLDGSPDLNQKSFNQQSQIVFDEKATGYPNPKIYDQYFINNYSLPKGLHSMRRDRSDRPAKKTLYDYKQPKQRHGISGWKLTRRPPQNFAPPAERAPTRAKT